MANTKGAAVALHRAKEDSAGAGDVAIQHVAGILREREILDQATRSNRRVSSRGLTPMGAIRNGSRLSCRDTRDCRGSR